MKKMNKDKTEYIECQCHCKGHIVRVSWDSEFKVFYFETAITGLPKTPGVMTIRKGLEKLKVYFYNIYRSVRGYPCCYDIEIIWTKKEMKRLSDFVNRCE